MSEKSKVGSLSEIPQIKVTGPTDGPTDARTVLNERSRAYLGCHESFF